MCTFLDSDAIFIFYSMCIENGFKIVFLRPSVTVRVGSKYVEIMRSKQLFGEIL